MPTGFTVRAVLFDMDGTLIDSTPAVDRAWAQWERLWNVRLGVRASSLGRPARDIVAERVPPESAEAAFRDIERLEVADTDDVVVLPGAVALLAALPADRWAIATSCSAPLAAARLAAAGIDARVVVTATDTALGKPHPDRTSPRRRGSGSRRRSASSSRTRSPASSRAALPAARPSGCSVRSMRRRSRRTRSSPT